MLIRETAAGYYENHTEQIQISVSRGVKPCYLVDITNLSDKSPASIVWIEEGGSRLLETLEHI
jgi:hypothetical protein